MLTLGLIGVLLACFVSIMLALLVGIKFSRRLHKLERSQMMLAVLLLAEVEKPPAWGNGGRHLKPVPDPDDS